jgi:type IV pilus assembly protein PilE
MGHKKGFTLVEMMIVCAIVALLAGLAIPNYMQHTRRARATEAVAAMTMIRQAERDYFITHSKYYDISSGNLDNDQPTSVNAADGAPTPSTAGAAINIGVTQYFSNSAFTVNAVDHSNSLFTSPGPQNFIITANGNNSDADCSDNDCAMNKQRVTAYQLVMDNTGRVFISFDSGSTWSAY